MAVLIKKPKKEEILQMLENDPDLYYSVQLMLQNGSSLDEIVKTVEKAVEVKQKIQVLKKARLSRRRN